MFDHRTPDRSKRRYGHICLGVILFLATIGTGAGTASAHGNDGPADNAFIAIQNVQPNVQKPPLRQNASTGTFTSSCGTNGNRHNNPDNFIVAPGVSNGAHHVHDYVGNLSTTGKSNNRTLAAAGTTCSKGDKSTYFWPALRNINRQGNDANAPGGGQDGNEGKILRPSSVDLTFHGNPTSKVVPMPTFLRMITGDAKALTNGPANARAQWTCSGFPDRTTTNYPLCPAGQQVQRILDFPSCWDGKNIDSANHRTHVVFPDNRGACPRRTRAIPQLRMTLSYVVPQGKSFAVDTFPEEMHDPSTDHADFANVMSRQLASQAATCINSGSSC